jgi:large subunit ribosomal protein L10
MRLEQKQEIAEDLRALLRDAGIVYLADFTGLTVEAMGALRVKLLQQGAQFRVVKNTLTMRALEGLDFPDLTEHIKGPTALVLGAEDPVMPAKVVRDFAREHDDRPVVKVGIVDRREISPAEVGQLADTPPMHQLLGSIAGGLTASVTGIAGALSAIIRDVAVMIEEDSRQGEA